MTFALSWLPVERFHEVPSKFDQTVYVYHRSCKLTDVCLHVWPERQAVPCPGNAFSDPIDFDFNHSTDTPTISLLCIFVLADYKVQPSPQQYAAELRKQAAEAAQARKERQRIEQEEEKLVGRWPQALPLGESVIMTWAGLIPHLLPVEGPGRENCLMGPSWSEPGSPALSGMANSRAFAQVPLPYNEIVKHVCPLSCLPLSRKLKRSAICRRVSATSTMLEVSMG